MVSLRTLCAVVVVVTHSVGISHAQNTTAPAGNKNCDKDVVSVAFKDLNIQNEVNKCKSKADLTSTLSEDFDLYKVKAGATPEEISKFCSEASCKTVIKAIIKGPKFDRTDCINSDGHNFKDQLLKLYEACEVFKSNTSAPPESSSPSLTSAPPSSQSPTTPSPSQTPNPTTQQPETTPYPSISSPAPQPTTDTPSLNPSLSRSTIPSSAPGSSPILTKAPYLTPAPISVSPVPSLKAPTSAPTSAPTGAPSNAPTDAPTSAPSIAPTSGTPSASQTIVPIPSTRSPSQAPSASSVYPSSPTQLPPGNQNNNPQSSVSPTSATPAHTESQQPVPKPARPSTEFPSSSQYC